MRVDSFEPLEIEALLKQSLPDTLRVDLNRHGFGDYLWYTYDNQPEQAERKQVSEVLANIEHVEYQVGGEIAAISNLFNMVLIVEGIAEPTPDGTQTYILSKDGRYYRKGRLFKVPYHRYEGWLMAMNRAGVIIWRTTSWISTAEALIRWQKSAESAVHTALHRHLKVRPQFHRNPQVESLMGLKGAELGPKQAEALIGLYGTMWDVLRQTPESLAETVPGIGLPFARKILSAAGKQV